VKNAFLLCVTVLFLGCGVKIDTGPSTTAEVAQSTEMQAKQFRAEWGERLRLAEPLAKAMMVKQLIDSVSNNYLRYGQNIADEWREGNRGRGAEVSDSEIREIVERSVAGQRPLFLAYEDVVEQGMLEIKRALFLDPQSTEQLETYANYLYDVYTAVFLPQGSYESFLSRIEHLGSTGEIQSQNLDEMLARFR